MKRFSDVKQSDNFECSEKQSLLSDFTDFKRYVTDSLSKLNTDVETLHTDFDHSEYIRRKECHN